MADTRTKFQKPMRESKILNNPNENSLRDLEIRQSNRIYPSIPENLKKNIPNNTKRLFVAQTLSYKKIPSVFSNSSQSSRPKSNPILAKTIESTGCRTSTPQTKNPYSLDISPTQLISPAISSAQTGKNDSKQPKWVKLNTKNLSHNTIEVSKDEIAKPFMMSMMCSPKQLGPMSKVKQGLASKSVADAGGNVEKCKEMEKAYISRLATKVRAAVVLPYKLQSFSRALGTGHGMKIKE